MKTLTDFRKTVETGVDPRLLTDLKPLFIPSAALALKCYECSEDPGSVGKCSGAKIGQIGNKTCVPLLNRCSTVRYTLKGTSLTALSCANSAGCDPLSQYSCKLKYQSFYRLIYLILTRNCHRFILRCTFVILSNYPYRQSSRLVSFKKITSYVPCWKSRVETVKTHVYLAISE